jgi:hypothetical protein
MLMVYHLVVALVSIVMQVIVDRSAICLLDSLFE